MRFLYFTINDRSLTHNIKCLKRIKCFINSDMGSYISYLMQ